MSDFTFPQILEMEQEILSSTSIDDVELENINLDTLTVAHFYQAKFMLKLNTKISQFEKSDYKRELYNCFRRSVVEIAKKYKIEKEDIKNILKYEKILNLKLFVRNNTNLTQFEKIKRKQRKKQSIINTLQKIAKYGFYKI